MKKILLSFIMLIICCRQSSLGIENDGLAEYEENAKYFLIELTNKLVENGFSAETCLCDTIGGSLDWSEIPYQKWEFDVETEQYVLRELQLVNLNGYLGSTLPSSINNLKDLELITINNCGLTSLPDSIVYLNNLKIVDVYNNQIEVLPDSLGLLRNLEILNLSNNQITIFPQTLDMIPSLSHLNINSNLIESIPPYVCELSDDVQLTLIDNSICFESDYPNCIDDKVLYQLNCYSENDLSVLDTLIYSNSITPELCNCDLNNNGTIQNFELGNQIWETNSTQARLKELSIDNINGLISILPDNSISQLSYLTLLKLSSNIIDILPSDLTDLISLQTLDLSDNLLDSLPENISIMSGLKYLDISNNDNLNFLPPIPNLDFIDIGYTNLFCDSTGFFDENLLDQLIYSVDIVEGAYYQYCRMQNSIQFLEDFANQNNLEYLSSDHWTGVGSQVWDDGFLIDFTYSGGSEVNNIPLSIGNLFHLKSLILNDNNINFVPDTLSQLSQLNYIDLNGNSLTEFNLDLDSMHFLSYLNLTSNQLTTLPNNICQLAGTTEIHLWNNRICDCNNEIGNECPIYNLDEMLLSQRCRDCNELQFLKDVIDINQIESEISDLGIQVWRLDSLTEHLYQFNFEYYESIYNNKVYDIPNSISNLEHIDTLILSKHSFNETVYRIFNLNQLSYLKLYADSLEYISGDIGKLINLKYLDLSDNFISDLPDSISYLNNLEIFKLDSNQFHQIPEIIYDMDQLTDFDISYNLISSIDSLYCESPFFDPTLSSIRGNNICSLEDIHYCLYDEVWNIISNNPNISNYIWEILPDSVVIGNIDSLFTSPVGDTLFDYYREYEQTNCE